MAKKIVRIDALPESAWRYSGYDAIVCIDVLLSATTIVTALAQGRRVFAAPTAGHAARLQPSVSDPLVVTDDLDRSEDPLPFAGPSWVATENGRARALVHISPLAEMLAAAASRARAYVACLRNLEPTANEIALHHQRVVILGAGDGGEVGAEDQMAAAWLAVRLRQRGFELEGRNTAEEVERWGDFDPSLVGLSRSAQRLRARGREAEVDFVLRHVDDLKVVAAFAKGEVRDPVAARRRLEDDISTPAWGTHLPAMGH
jgi:phosphosulfolactate phosphohydrolase-like enzyme